jgi:hypothetical protein
MWKCTYCSGRYIYQESNINKTISTFYSEVGDAKFNHTFTNDRLIDIYSAIYNSSGQILVYEMIGQLQFYAYNFSESTFQCLIAPLKGFDKELTIFTFNLENSNKYNEIIQKYTYYCN